MDVSSWRGGWCVGVLGIAALIVVALMFGPGTGDAATRAPAAAKKCAKAIVGGKHACLRKGDKCKKRYQDDYVRAGLACKKARLRKASIKQLRGPEPLLIDKQGQLSVKTAMAGFDTAIAPLPGVKPKKGEVGAVKEATSVVNTLEASAKKLTSAQRNVLAAATTPAPDAIVVPPRMRPPPGSSRARPTWRDRPPPAPTRAGSSTPTAPPTSRSTRWRISASRGTSCGRTASRFCDRSASHSRTPRRAQAASRPTPYVTSTDLPPGTSPNCNMFITKNGREASAAIQQLVYAHELAHCAQHAFVSSQAEYKKVPQWVKEGGADWLGGDDRPGDRQQPVEEVDWEPWLEEPTDDLFTRSYSGVGFFAMIQQAGVDGWARMRDTLFAASGGNSAAYPARDRRTPGRLLQALGPRAPARQDPRIGVGLRGSRYRPEHPRHDCPRKRLERAAHDRPAGLGRRQDQSQDRHPDHQVRQGRQGQPANPRRYAARWPRAPIALCPGAASASTRTQLQLPKVGTTAAFGFNDPFKARTVTFQGKKLKDYCKNPSPGPGTEGPGGGGSCPTTPTARPAARRECPAPSPGIGVYLGEDAVKVANFTIGSCTQGAGGFTAIAVDGAWRLEVGISNFTGFGDYEVPVRRSRSGGGDRGTAGHVQQ